MAYFKNESSYRFLNEAIKPTKTVISQFPQPPFLTRKTKGMEVILNQKKRVVPGGIFPVSFASNLIFRPNWYYGGIS